MDWYLCSLTGGLMLAASLNFLAGSIRGMALAYVAMLFLIVISPIFPNRDELGDYWYPSVMALETLFYFIAINIKSDASKVVAGISAYNLLCHFCALIAYNYGYTPDAQHSAMVRIGELAQVASLIFFTKPVARLVIAVLQGRSKDRDSGYKLVATPNR